MIDWPKRLANEEPFYRWLFERAGAKAVLDTACGTGHHAVMFSGWGLTAEGADLSESMIERCRAKWGESECLRWVVRGFDQPAGEGRFDVAICMGNSLALAGDLPAVSRAISRMLAAVRPGGMVVAHVLNLWRLPDGECQWQKCRRASFGDGEQLIIKGVHRSGGRGYVDMLVTRLDTTLPQLDTDSVPFLGLRGEDLEAAAILAGAAQTELYGTYARGSYDADQSQDLILVARRGVR